MTAEEHLSELQKLATARLKACNQAAKHQGLTLVDSARLELLESLLIAAQAAFSTGTYTREYTDVLERDKNESYNGERFLIRRNEGSQVCRVLSNLKAKNLMAGCLALSKE